MSLLNKTASLMHRQHGWFVSDRFIDNGTSHGNWQVKGADKTGLASLSINLKFSSKYSIACYLSSYTEVHLRNSEAVGNALADLYRKKGNDWKLNQLWVYTALHVKSGFIVMSKEKDIDVTLSGQGTVSASGVPIDINVDGFLSSASSSVEMVGLAGISPLIKLAKLKDGPFSKADWHQIG
jgi:hypothetical protein